MRDKIDAVPCIRCGGKGTVDSRYGDQEACRICFGSGKTPELTGSIDFSDFGSRLYVTHPEEVDVDGTKLRYSPPQIVGLDLAELLKPGKVYKVVRQEGGRLSLCPIGDSIYPHEPTVSMALLALGDTSRLRREHTNREFSRKPKEALHILVSLMTPPALLEVLADLQQKGLNRYLHLGQFRWSEDFVDYVERTVKSKVVRSLGLYKGDRDA